VTNNGNVRDLRIRNATGAAGIPNLPAGMRNLILIWNSAGLVLPALTLTGTLTVTTGGGITQSGILSIALTTNLTVTVALTDIDLSTQANVFDGLITVTNNGNVRDLLIRNATGAAGIPSLPAGMRNLTLTWNSTGLVLPVLTLTGTLTVTTGGNITESGALTVAGIATFTPGAANSTTLNTAANDFATVVVTNGINAAFQDSNAIILGAITITGVLTVKLGGEYHAECSFDDWRSIDVRARSGELDDFEYVCQRFRDGLVTNGTNASFQDSNAIILGAITITGALTVNSAGNITQSAALTIGGLSTFAPGAANSTILNTLCQRFRDGDGDERN